MTRLRTVVGLLFFTAARAQGIEPVTLVQDPTLLTRVPLPLARFLGAEGKVEHNGTLYERSQAYRNLVDSIAEDLVQLRMADPRLDVTMAKAHRLFDVRWLLCAPQESRKNHTKGDGLTSRLPRWSVPRPPGVTGEFVK